MNFKKIFLCFNEATKKRFLDKYADSFTRYGITDHKDFLKYVDTVLDSKLKQNNKIINWQKLSDDDIKYIVDSYNEYIFFGGSLKIRKLKKKDDPNNVFIDNNKGLKAVFEGEDFSNADFLILSSLENEKYIFIVPLTYEACVYIDSLECGGAGAKWCIGYAKENKFFNDYTKIQENGIAANLFVLAFNKNTYKNLSKENENNLKYMIDINQTADTFGKKEDFIADEIVYWDQLDYKYEANIFNINYSVLVKTFFKTIIYSKYKSIYVDNHIFRRGPEDFVYIDYDNQPQSTDTLPIENIDKVKSEINKINEFITEDSMIDYILLHSVMIEEDNLIIEYSNIHDSENVKFTQNRDDYEYIQKLGNAVFWLVKNFLLYHIGVVAEISDYKQLDFLTLENDYIQMKCNLSNIRFRQCEEVAVNNEEKIQKIWLHEKYVLVLASEYIFKRDMIPTLKKYGIFLLSSYEDDNLGPKDGRYIRIMYRNILKEFLQTLKAHFA